MPQPNYSVSSKLTQATLLLTSLLLLSNCGRTPEPEIITQTEYLTRTIPTQPRPKPVVLNDVKWYVVTQDNLQEFLTTFEKENGPVAFMAVSVKGYENISLNVQELRRFILQQNAVIVYYENAVQNPPEQNSPEQPQ